MHIQRAQGESLKLVGGEVAGAHVRLVETVVVPGQKAKFVKARLDVPLIKGEELMFEPDEEVLSRCGLTAPESLLTLTSDDSLLVPVENHGPIPVRLDVDVVVGQVARPDHTLEPLSSAKPSEEVQPAQSLQVEADVSLSVDSRKQRLMEMLGMKNNLVDVSEEQNSQLRQLLEDNHDVFALENGELGCADVVQHVIDTENHPPIKQPVRRMPFVHCEKVSAMVDEMLDQGVIQPSVSPWSSPIV